MKEIPIPPPLHEKVRKFSNDLLEGRVTDAVIIYRNTDGTVRDFFGHNIDGAKGDAFALVGALEITKRDWMRTFIQSRVEYQPLEDQDE